MTHIVRLLTKHTYKSTTTTTMSDQKWAPNCCLYGCCCHQFWCNIVGVDVVVICSISGENLALIFGYLNMTTTHTQPHRHDQSESTYSMNWTVRKSKEKSTKKPTERERDRQRASALSKLVILWLTNKCHTLLIYNWNGCISHTFLYIFYAVLCVCGIETALK